MKLLVIFLLVLCVFTCCRAWAGRLEPRGWKISGPNPRMLNRMVDNDLDTVWRSDGPQTPGMAVTVDIGRPAYIYRVFLTPGHAVSEMARSLEILVGDSPETLQPVAQQRFFPGTISEAAMLRNFIANAIFALPPVTGATCKFAWATIPRGSVGPSPSWRFTPPPAPRPPVRRWR